MTAFDAESENLDFSDINFSMAYHALEDLPTSNIFITGGAGTGKSVILASYYYRLIERKKNVAVVSPTGVSAAILRDKGIPAVTIHSLFQLHPHPIFEKKVNLGRDKKKIFNALDYVLIDEISMVSPSLFDHVKWVLDEVGFKGRIILFGDPLQLSPVVNLDNPDVFDYYLSHSYVKSRYEKPQFYSGSAYKELKPEVFALTAIYRQDDDKFASVLSRIRKGEETDDDLTYINERVIKSKEYYQEHENALYLASTNAIVDRLNKVYEARFEGQKCMAYTSESEGSMKKDEEDTIVIYKGEQVMCIHNNSEEDYQNGTLGIVEDFDEESVFIRTTEGPKRVVYEKWTDYKVEYDKKTHTVETNESGSYCQIGCKPTFATTIHKAQGLTLDAVYVNLNSTFLPIAAVYLALSRVKTIEGLGISRPISKNDIKVDENVKLFYQGLSTLSNASLLNAFEYE